MVTSGVGTGDDYLGDDTARNISACMDWSFSVSISDKYPYT